LLIVHLCGYELVVVLFVFIYCICLAIRLPCFNKHDLSWVRVVLLLNTLQVLIWLYHSTSFNCVNDLVTIGYLKLVCGIISQASCFYFLLYIILKCSKTTIQGIALCWNMKVFRCTEWTNTCSGRVLAAGTTGTTHWWTNQTAQVWLLLDYLIVCMWAEI